ncbi:TRAP transporter substrate-binding protein [Bordetella sp. 2513F-2]
MMQHLRKIAIALVAPCVLSATAHAADIQSRTLKFSHVQPADSHMGLGVKMFAEAVAKKSGNKIKVRDFAGGTLGGDLQTLSALQGGTIDLTTLPPSLMVGLDPAYGVFDLPFLFDNFNEADKVLDGAMGRKFLENAPNGLVGLAYWDHGFRNVSNSKHAITRPEDFQGLKLRVVQTPLMVESFKALGANPIPLSFTELFTAMETKAVDGQDNPIVAFETNKFQEVQGYLSQTRHVYNPLIVLISEKTWNKLSDDEKQIIASAAEEVRTEQRRVSRAMEQKSIEQIKAQGVTVSEISPQERARMRELTQPVAERLAKDIGPDVVAAMQEEVRKVRAQ